MIKIDQNRKVLESNTGLPGTPSSPAAGSVESEPSAFSKALLRTQESLQKETMDKLLKMVDLQAQRLMKSPVLAEITVYRELIRRFLKEANAKIARIDKRTDRRNRPLILIREVDKKLAELTDKVLKGQAKPIEILALVNEIGGLLVDLMI